ncbi:MAG: universal stress protein [Micromonosporaceae bacterium]|nr:universal stress protein [Micromonosporaceae bacterium]
MADNEVRPIVVGVDGSEDSIRAARWAVDEARLRDRPVELVHAYTWPVPMVPLAPPPVDWTETSLRQAAEALLADVLAKVRADAGREAKPAEDVSVTASAHAGPAPYTLLDQARRADMVVVGHRGHGGFAGLLLGSVAATVAAHAECPVAVVRPYPGGRAPDGLVLVGADGSPASSVAVGFAFEEAKRRGAQLGVVHAWRPPVRFWGGDEPSPDHVHPSDLESGQLRQLQEWIQPWRDKYPEVDVRWMLTVERPAAALVEAAREATLVVVGSRGHGGFAGLLLGSVSQQLINHAPCPVVVVR